MPKSYVLYLITYKKVEGKNILKKLVSKLSFIKGVAFATYKEWSAYRSHMIVSLIIGPLYFLVQIFIWKAVFSSKGVLNGLTLDQMISYYGIAALIHYCIMDFADWNFQMLIRTGQFITYLLRPMNPDFLHSLKKLGTGFWDSPSNLYQSI